MSGGQTIGPNDFVGGPYIKCPSCGDERLGVLGIRPRLAIRRCTNCQMSFTAELPNLDKRMIFLDQSAISNMMRALHPKLGREGPHSDFWRTLFLKLDRLVRMQLIACPYTSVHKEESVLDSRIEAHLLRVARHLAAGIEFAHRRTIEIRQVDDAARMWLNGVPIVLDPASARVAVRGDRTAWRGRLELLVKTKWSQSDIDTIRTVREDTAKGWLPVFERWIRSPVDFTERFREEALGYGRAILEASLRRRQRLMDIQAGRANVTEDGVIPSFADPVAVVLDTFIAAGLGQEARERVLAFFASDAMLDIPFNRLRAMLLASLSRELQRGRKQPVDLGTPADFAAISSSLPYCDAMLVDNKCAEYLGQAPLAREVARFNSRIFSLRLREDFLSYLDAIEASATEQHRQLVEQLYGPMPTAPTLTFDSDEPGDDSAAGAPDALA